MSTAVSPEQQQAPLAPAWDEMANGTGRLRPGWGTLIASLFGLGAETVARRAALLDQMLTEDGVSGLLPGAEPVGWRLDPVPLLIGAAEFAALEAGLAQRASLIEAVLQDIYGPQDLIADGSIPPDAVFADPAFLRPCCVPPGEPPPKRLFHYAAELVRDVAGRWTVVADRTGDAAGIGYALENRRALSRAMPEIFRTVPPRSLGPFFEAWQDALIGLAPPGVERPLAALLTKGADDKLWFEHVVLARELSLALVESTDLTVRDGAVFLKTLQGLQRVHVLLRRQSGATLDPLELELMPRLGVTGLLDAARGGSVRVVNDPGAACIESAIWLSVLPGLCERVLGRAPKLPTLETAWLGDDAARALVLADQAAWRLHGGGAFGGRAAGPSPRWDEALAAPERFVATRPIAPSLAPCFGEDGLAPQPMVLRMFLAFDGHAWRALPGGLARVLAPTDIASGRLPLHALCKDVWVATEEEEDIIGPALRPVAAAIVRRAPGDLPSRVADNFFWLGRNLERMESVARLLRGALERIARPGPSPREEAELRTALGCLSLAGLLERDAVTGLSAGPLGQRLLAVARPPAELPGLVAEVNRMGELLRDRLTREVHGTLLQGLRLLGQGLAKLRAGESGTVRDLEELCGQVLSFSATMAGLAAENMVRSGGRLFLDLGRRIERAWWTSRMLACALDHQGAAHQPALLEPGLRLSLELCDSLITYRNRYVTTLQAGPVLDLVIADEGNPRSIAFQLTAIRDVLVELARAPGAELPLGASTLLKEARDIARTALVMPDRTAAVTLPTRLRALERDVTKLSDRIARQYFAVLPVAHLLEEPSGEGEGDAG